MGLSGLGALGQGFHEVADHLFGLLMPVPVKIAFDAIGDFAAVELDVEAPVSSLFFAVGEI